MFGPYAGFSTKFLKHGRVTDLPASLRRENVLPLMQVAQDKKEFVAFLIKAFSESRGRKIDQLLDYLPSADPEKWG